jgi:alcohol dehydrogenase class IV
LSSELTHTAKDLREALPPAGAKAEFTDGLKQVDALAAALRQMRSHIHQPDELARQKIQIATIRKQLQEAISSL